MRGEAALRVSLVRMVSGGLTPIILLAAAVAAGSWGLRSSVVRGERREAAARETMIATVRATKGKFQVVVPIIGQLAAVNSKPARTEVTGQIVKLVPNGAYVEKGDVIAILDVPRMLRQVREQDRQHKQALDDLARRKRDSAAQVQSAALKLEQAKGELERHQAQLKVELTQTRSQKDKDAADLELAKQRFERQRKLSAEGLSPGREIELAEAQLKSMEFALERETKQLELAEAKGAAEELDRQAAVREAESALASAKSRQEADVSGAQMALEMAKQQLDRVREQYAKATIKSPGEGIVVMEQEWQGRGNQQRPVQAGDRVWEGRPIATIADLSEMRVDIELDQEQARQVKTKQPAVIAVDAVPGVTFDGKVTEVSQTANESSLPGTGIPSGERSFQAKVSIVTAPPKAAKGAQSRGKRPSAKQAKQSRLRPGMSAQARIIVETLPKAVSVPLECVFEKEDRQYVYVRRGERFLPVEVQLGPRDADVVVIAKGLKGGEEVALRDPGERGASGEASESPSTTAPTGVVR